MIATLAALLLPLALAAEPAPGCGEVAPVPETFQVAWITPVRKRARASASLEVVRVGDLRAWIRQEEADQTRLLQAMGLASARGGGRANREWKVTIFDVAAGGVCRPVLGAPEGEVLAGAPACGEAMGRLPARETGCGYSFDKLTEDRGLDTFRVTWRDASAQGFCVFPLERFLEGA